MTQWRSGEERDPGYRVWGVARRSCVAVLILLLMMVGGVSQPAYAQEMNRAGLVVVDGAGVSRNFCVAFPEDEISGYELLRRTSLELTVEASAMGATICAIDAEGCAYPAESCFCQCQGSPCVYWSYWTLTPAGWRYETLGAGNTRIRDGDVQGWRWGAGSVKEAREPPAITLAEICVAEPPAAAAGEATVPAVAAGVLTLPANLTNPTVPSTQGAAAAVATRSGLQMGDVLVWLGVLVVPLALGGWLLWRRRVNR